MDSIVMVSQKRPGWVWTISIFYFFSAASTILYLYLVYSGEISFQQVAKAAYLESLTFIDMGLSILIGLTNLIGAVLLFRLRKQAFYFLAFPFAAGLLMTIWHIFSKGFIAAMPLGWLVGMFLGWGIIITVLLYIKKLGKAGILS